MLNGALDEPAWKEAFHTDRFFTAKGRRVTDPKTEFWLGFRGDFLYIAMRIVGGPADVAGAAGPAENVWDHMQIFLDPSLGLRPFLRLGFDYAGHYEQQFFGPTWMGKADPVRGRNWPGRWRVATRRGTDEWTAEIQIAFGAVTTHFPPGNGLGGNTEWWGLNVVRSKALGPQRLFLAPNFTEPNNPGHFDPRRWAKLAGINNNMTLPLACRLAPPPQVFTGPNKFRVVIERGITVGQQDLELRLTGHAFDGTMIEQSKRFKRSNPERARSLPVTLNIPQTHAGGWQFSAVVTRADDRKGPTVGHILIVHARAARRGALEVRTGRNYYTRERSALLRAIWWDRAVPPGSRVHVRVLTKDGPEGGEPVGGQDVLVERDHPVETNPFVVELPLTKLASGQFEVELRLMGTERELASTTVALIRRVARHNAVKIRWDNFLIVQDEPFFSLFLYNPDVFKARELGANALMCEAAT